MIEDIPLPDGSVDVVISNCVFNLSVDKPKVIIKMSRVLSPGWPDRHQQCCGPDHHLRVMARAEEACTSAASLQPCLSQERLDGLIAAGFTNATVRCTHQATDRVDSAIIQATKPERPA